VFSAIHLIAEERIREAERRGEFADLPACGRLELDAYFALPEDLRMAYTMLRNSGHLPEEAVLAKDIETTRDLLRHCGDEAEKHRRMQKLNWLTLKLNALRNRPAYLDGSPYYDSLVDRVSVRDPGD